MRFWNNLHRMSTFVNGQNVALLNGLIGTLSSFLEICIIFIQISGISKYFSNSLNFIITKFYYVKMRQIVSSLGASVVKWLRSLTSDHKSNTSYLVSCTSRVELSIHLPKYWDLNGIFVCPSFSSPRSLV